jgi:hypothetical protein
VKRFRSEQADMVDVGGAHDADGAGDLSECEIVGAFYEGHFFGALFEGIGLISRPTLGAWSKACAHLPPVASAKLRQSKTYRYRARTASSSYA